MSPSAVLIPLVMLPLHGWSRTLLMQLLSPWLYVPRGSLRVLYRLLCVRGTFLCSSVHLICGSWSAILFQSPPSAVADVGSISGVFSRLSAELVVSSTMVRAISCVPVSSWSSGLIFVSNVFLRWQAFIGRCAFYARGCCSLACSLVPRAPVTARSIPFYVAGVVCPCERLGRMACRIGVFTLDLV